MVKKVKTEKACPKGHKFFKSSDCPICPICESNKKVLSPELKSIAAPARRALECIGVNSILQLSKFKKSEIMGLHGIGPDALNKMKKAMDQLGLAFKK